MNYVVIIDEPNYLGGIRYIERFFKILNNIKTDVNIKIITINFILADSSLSKQNELVKVNKLLYKLDKIFVRITNYSFYSNFFTKNNPNSTFWFSNIFISNKKKKKYNVQVVNWIPDFQFLDFPNYFSIYNKISRYFYLRLQIKYSDVIILQSKFDKDRLAIMHPKYCQKYFIWQFYEPVNSSQQNKFLDSIPLNYFLYPHQMWKHKRHDLLLDFFSKNPEFNLVLTGQLIDVRDKEYTDNIKMFLRKNFKNIFKLGKVSSSELVYLMKNAKAILNLSEYEGWSSCIEEAISFNVPLVLNTILINKEQIPEAYYVDIKNENWQENLKQILQNLKPIHYNILERKEKSLEQLNNILKYLN
jgi:hypothetical protein